MAQLQPNTNPKRSFTKVPKVLANRSALASYSFKGGWALMGSRGGSLRCLCHSWRSFESWSALNRLQTRRFSCDPGLEQLSSGCERNDCSFEQPINDTRTEEDGAKTESMDENTQLRADNERLKAQNEKLRCCNSCLKQCYNALVQEYKQHLLDMEQRMQGEQDEWEEQDEEEQAMLECIFHLRLQISSLRRVPYEVLFPIGTLHVFDEVTSDTDEIDIEQGKIQEEYEEALKAIYKT
ncbi:hypothetical protein C8F01DRAFT_1239649 [Mycena amicta]|nr:hypothetical protein C8F01DRAFT_1239649 [Mycena amicta]